MGCWNHTCCVSNLHVNGGQDVFVFLLVKKRNIYDGSFCYVNALYDVVPLPFYGKYDDYGGVEDCHGFGIPIILDHLKNRLYKFGQGPNSVHDCEVNAENLTIEKLFEADREGRLGIEDPEIWNEDEYNIRVLERIHDERGLSDSEQFELDRLASKIKKQDTFREVTHVVIHSDVAKAILEKWYIEKYVGNGMGNTGYKNNYNHIYFKDLIDSIPDFIQTKKDKKEKLAKAIDAGANLQQSKLYRRIVVDDHNEWNSPNLATRWMHPFNSTGVDNVWELIDVKECIEKYTDADDWEGMATFTKEVLTAAWINSFMTYTRKIWVKQAGQGSQRNEPLGYQVLAQATLDILKAEKLEYGDEDDEDDSSDIEELSENLSMKENS